MEFYVAPFDQARAFAVLRGHECVFARVEGSVTEQRKEALRDLFITRSRDLKIIKEQEEKENRPIGGKGNGNVKTLRLKKK